MQISFYAAGEVHWARTSWPPGAGARGRAERAPGRAQRRVAAAALPRFWKG